jgi:hypothetical protein
MVDEAIRFCRAEGGDVALRSGPRSNVQAVPEGPSPATVYPAQSEISDIAK